MYRHLNPNLNDMKKIYFLALLFTSVVSAQVNVGITGNVDGVYINEFHYDNAGGDVGEFIEVAGPAGTDLSTYFITLYNGNNGASYSGEGLDNPLQLSGTIDDEGTGVGAVVFFISGIQNGNPDGFALSNGGTDIQFLSYEGSFMAVGGAADGLTSEDIGISQVGAPIGSSLEYDESGMSWVSVADDTPGDYGAVLSVAQNDIEDLRLYPNPVTNGKVTITTAKNLIKRIVVYDVLGKAVINRILEDQVLDVSSLNSGIYFLKITEDAKTATRKLVVR